MSMKTESEWVQTQSTILYPDIVLEPKLRLTAKAIYMAILVRPNLSISELGELLHAHRETVSIHVRALKDAGWVVYTEGRRLCPTEPPEVRKRKACWFKQVLPMKPFIGEFLSFSWLDELIPCLDYVDHARPSLLTNPVTGQPMEYDRFYPRYRKAFENQGLQHFGPTYKYPDPKQAKEQRLRDWAKLGMSHWNDIELVTITWRDLSLRGMSNKIPKDLPRRPINPKDPYIQCLEQESAKYRASMRLIEKSLPQQ
ncbi:MAG: MarR family transcriptional regulator [Bacillota bacterium]|jgi:DNA-binding CsgD family transcriptional regulator